MANFEANLPLTNAFGPLQYISAPCSHELFYEFYNIINSLTTTESKRTGKPVLDVSKKSPSLLTSVVGLESRVEGTTRLV